ncbi:hypothetical protein RFI_15210 [Reticulomyxa filosa]|uniref:Uncharacterized protein n=1 Tax=Reticulomyxa filosa TaxID=46433 RepID=X6N8C6_RETFI|nr:hypothetical protein RFI_15210 [Reticulomyxa filosa]|eukprot:ETO21994.1 hypothetical protein RFI_15210 [Reticulomyxa filosa]
MEENLQLPSFVATACDALSNVCFENEKQRRLTAQTKAVPLLISTMKKYFDKFGIQYACARSLGNLLSEPRAQQAFDEEAVRVLLESLNSQFSADSQHMKGPSVAKQQENQGLFAQHVITVLSFLVGDPKKAAIFASSGGFVTMKNLYLAVGVWEENTRQSLLSLINNMSQNPQTAKLFIDNLYEGYDMLCELVSEADPQSQFFLQVYSILTALERYYIGRVSHKALQQDNVKLQEAVVSLIAIGARTKDKGLDIL